MKKLIVLLSILVLLVSGCSINQLGNNITTNIDTILSEKVNVYNVNFEGYKYYVPKGLKFVTKNDYNALFRDKYNNKYYLYVDAISYYHESKNKYVINKDAYYSEKLDYNNKTGYVEINEVDGKYFVEFVFNYSKIEVYTDKKYLSSVINNICYVLRSVKFNDKVLESLIGENVLSYKEETFNIFKSKSSSNDFLDYVKEYDSDNKKSKLDEDTVDIDVE